MSGTYAYLWSIICGVGVSTLFQAKIPDQSSGVASYIGEDEEVVSSKNRVFANEQYLSATYSTTECSNVRERGSLQPTPAEHNTGDRLVKKVGLSSKRGRAMYKFEVLPRFLSRLEVSRTDVNPKRYSNSPGMQIS